ncbi:PREDICTED: uncharacterized protein LOC106819915 [Priapulus caudatus]|uniref:Uncharacterized protein LOC106819915 n=1 Tax=Priapulus caudatus TaxID=37621 RepID=A0ABM1F6A4_PRICU|nr:PREDICTED: uncharacterized protein LOC106819915 [Priapulus caudatus]
MPSRDTLDEFLDGGNLEIYRYGMSKTWEMCKIWYAKYFLTGTSTPEESDPPETVIKRAESQIGDVQGIGTVCNGGYDMLINNCEHFALWCKLGERAQKVPTQLNKVFGNDYIR